METSRRDFLGIGTAGLVGMLVGGSALKAFAKDKVKDPKFYPTGMVTNFYPGNKYGSQGDYARLPILNKSGGVSFIEVYAESYEDSVLGFSIIPAGEGERIISVGKNEAEMTGRRYFPKKIHNAVALNRSCGNRGIAEAMATVKDLSIKLREAEQTHVYQDEILHFPGYCIEMGKLHCVQEINTFKLGNREYAYFSPDKIEAGKAPIHIMPWDKYAVQIEILGDNNKYQFPAGAIVISCTCKEDNCSGLFEFAPKVEAKPKVD